MAEMGEEIAVVFREVSCRTLRDMADRLGKCLDRLNQEQIWHRGGDHENAVGNLVLHLCGNMMQWIMHGVAGEPDVRQRELEFSAGGGLTAKELTELFRTTVEDVAGVIQDLPATRLTERITPQGRDVSVLEAVFHVTAHVEMHVGQIILLTKQMLGEDLDLTILRPRASPSKVAARFGV